MKKVLFIFFLSLFSFNSHCFAEIALFKNMMVSVGKSERLSKTLSVFRLQNNKNEELKESDFLGEEISGKAGSNISSYMQKQEKYFSSIKNVTIKRLRGGEVLEISIPTESLFQNNDSTFTEMADLSLRPILTFVRKNTTDLVVGVHTDNTGSKSYLESISLARAKALENWFVTNRLDKKRLEVVSYADSLPVETNDSMLNRRKNRRVTFYLIPNKEMIKQAKKGKL